MPPKSHRTGVSRHGRSTSASKISAGHSSSRLAQTAGLQFTHSKLDPVRKEDKSRKAAHLTEPRSRSSSPFPRPASRNSTFQRTRSRDNVSGLQPFSTKTPAPRRKPGKAFTLTASNSESDEEDAWTSESASGAVTPNVELHSDNEDSNSRRVQPKAFNDRPDLTRVDTARATSGGLVATGAPDRTPLQTDSKPLIESHSAINLARPLSQPPTPPQPLRLETRLVNGHNRNEPQTQPSTPNYSRQSKRYSSHRPPSVHSLTSHPMARPHPLIRGASFAEPSAATTVDVLGANSESGAEGDDISPPASLRSLASPTKSMGRRPSVSSVATLPLPSPNPASSALQATQQRDRQRTLSTMSTSSSGAGLSSFFHHLPSLSRAPSPPHQVTKSLVGKRTKFPPAPLIHVREGGADVLALPDGTAIHPLLPAPYMQPHLTVLSTASPFRLSFDRVRYAKAHRQNKTRS